MSAPITPFWWRPDHQPNPDSPVEFHLKPLDWAALYEVQCSLAGRMGTPSPEACQMVFRQHVLDWKGLPEPCNAETKAKVLARGSPAWLLWIPTITGHLYRCALLAEDQQKN